MFGFLKSKKSKVESRPSVSSTSGPQTLGAMMMTREMIRVALKDTLRTHGVPLEWVGCEVINAPDRSGTMNTYIVLIMKCWDEKLLKYGGLIEKKLMERINWYEPHADHSKFTYSWSYGKDCQCPYMEMPEADYWKPKVYEQLQESRKEFFDRRKQKREELAVVFIHDDEQLPVENVHYLSTTIGPLT